MNRWWRTTLGRTLAGPAGTAVEVIPSPGAPPHTSVSTWFLTCPGQSVAWADYVMSVIHLRHVDGVGDAHVRVAGATHELILFAIDPRGKHPDPTDVRTWCPLSPLNVEEQFHLHSDHQAVELAALAAQAVVDGVLWAEPPLSGQVEPWRTALIKTTAHLRGEEHAP